jgi:hypothetical protein
MAQATEIVILRDGAGHYYLLPKTAIEQARVPEQYVGEVEKLIAGGFAAAELSDQQLESVAGGGTLSSFGSFQAPSGLSFSGFQDNWKSVDSSS